MKKKIYPKIMLLLIAVTMSISACTPAPLPVETVEPTAIPMVIPATESPKENVASADATPTASTNIKDGGTVNFFISSSPDTFIPQYTLGAHSRYFGNLLFPRLARYNSDTTILPYLAKDWKISDDGLTYTFNLVDNATWTDGQPVTAKDVVWTYNLMLNKEYAGTRRVEAPITGIQDYQDGVTDTVEGIQSPDQNTVIFTLDTPYTPFLENVAQQFWILPKHAMEETPIAEMDKHPFSQNPTVTSGPLKFVKYETDQYVELERNPDFILGSPHIEKFIYKVLKADVALAQFEKGELDATTTVGVMLPSYVEKLNTLPVRVVPVAGSASQVMGINNAKPYFSDKRVRQALVMAIDRVAIGKSLLSGYSMILNATIPEFSPYFNPAVKDVNAYNPEQAKELLQEAGWDFNREITLNFPTGNLTRERSAPIIQQYLQDVGIKVKLESLDFAAQSKKCNSPDGCDLWLVGSSFVNFDPDVKASYHTDSIVPNGWNSWRWSNPDADELMDKGLEVTDFTERKAIYDEFQTIVAEEVPVVYLYYPMDIHVVSNRLKNAEPLPVGIQWNIQEWYLDE